MANALSGLAQALLGGAQKGFEATAQTGFQQRQVQQQQQAREQDIAAQRKLQQEKLEAQKTLELDKIAAKGKVDKEIKQLDVAGKFNVATLQTRTQQNIANQKNRISELQLQLDTEENQLRRERLAFDIEHETRKLDQQIKNQDKLAEIQQLRADIAGETNEIARDRLKSEYTHKQSLFEYEKEKDANQLELSREQLRLETAKSDTTRRNAVSNINKIENDMYKDNLAAYKKYEKGKQATDDTLRAVRALINDPKGLKAAAGVESNFYTVGGSKAASFEAGFETLKAKIFIEQIGHMVNLGSLSDAEGKRLAAAAEALSLNMSDKELLEGLKFLETSLLQSQERASTFAIDKPVKPTPLKWTKPIKDIEGAEGTPPPSIARRPPAAADDTTGDDELRALF